MTTLYKLTDQNGYTREQTSWLEGTSHSKEPVDNPELCSEDVFHAYTSINLGLLLNPSHANIINPRLFECEGDVVVSDWGKVGCFELSSIQELDVPEWYVDIDMRKLVNVQFAILCAEQVLSIFEDAYPEDDRPRKAVEAAKEYLNNSSSAAADAAAYAAASAAASAAADAAYAASAAADAAHAASAAYAAYAAYAADAADAADAAYAASAAADAAHIDFTYMANLAVQMIVGK